MDFKETQAIYLQIVDLVCDNIMTGKWKAGERVPSVRELGVQLEVNPNTVMRAYDCLQAVPYLSGLNYLKFSGKWNCWGFLSNSWLRCMKNTGRIPKAKKNALILPK